MVARMHEITHGGGGRVCCHAGQREDWGPRLAEGKKNSPDASEFLLVLLVEGVSFQGAIALMKKHRGRTHPKTTRKEVRSWGARRLGVEAFSTSDSERTETKQNHPQKSPNTNKPPRTNQNPTTPIIALPLRSQKKVEEANDQ